MPQVEFKHELGAKVRDRVTGYEGIVSGRHEYLYGCRRYTVQSQEKKDGKPVDPIGFDEDALEVLIPGNSLSAPHVPAKTGGPRDEPSRRTDPVR